MKPKRKRAAAAPAKKKTRAKRTAAPRNATAPVKRGKRFAPAAERAPEIYRLLSAEYPDAKCALDYRNPYELLVATILSAQCTDKRVNMVTPGVFAKYPDAEAMAAAKPDELEEMIKSTGFFRNKTKSLLGMSGKITEAHGGEVPATMAELVTLPGVGRKTANVVLGNAFGRDEGVVVDTHVSRLSQRLALSRENDAGKIEQDLMALFPREQWTMLAHLLISHGRAVCIARRPLCERCVVNHLCPSSRV
ncbi:MAG TPA: endonuclease III [Gemmatimonadaceae bacterium]|nr:endonuclease III [Gemmatimonadaceae bacterium]